MALSNARISQVVAQVLRSVENITAPSNARVSQIVAQVLQTAPPATNARVSQIVSQTLRTIEAQYSSGNSNTSTRVAKFKGVRNLTIKPLPYNHACLANHNFAQSMSWPMIVEGSFFTPNTTSHVITNGQATLLGPLAEYTFTLTAGGASHPTVNPVMFGQFLIGTDDTGRFWYLRKPGTWPEVFATQIVQPAVKVGGAPLVVNPQGDMQMVAVNSGSRLAQNINAGYLAPGAALSTVADLLGILEDPVGFVFATLFKTILGAMIPFLGFLNPPPYELLLTGFLCDYTSGGNNGSLALQCSSALAFFPTGGADVPPTNFYKVPFGQMGGDPDLYIARAGQIFCDLNIYNSYQWWNASGAFGLPGSLLYDFNHDTFFTVSLDDPTMDGVFQTASANGEQLIATPQGWVAVLQGTPYGLMGDTVLLIAGDFSTWQILNFIPSDEAGNALLSTNAVLHVSADKSGFYVGTAGNDYQFTGAADNTPSLPIQPQGPVPVGCINTTCGNANTTGQWLPINPTFN